MNMESQLFETKKESDKFKVLYKNTKFKFNEI